MPAMPLPATRDLFSYRKYWAHRFGPAPFLPTSRAWIDETLARSPPAPMLRLLLSPDEQLADAGVSGH
jgi:hypothetical protein